MPCYGHLSIRACPNRISAAYIVITTHITLKPLLNILDQQCKFRNNVDFKSKLSGYWIHWCKSFDFAPQMNTRLEYVNVLSMQFIRRLTVHK